MKRPPTHSERYSLQKDTDPLGQRKPEVRQHHPEEKPEVPWHQYLVHEDLVHPDRGRLYRRAQGHEHQDERQPATVRPRVGPVAPEDLARRHRRRRSHEFSAFLNSRQQEANSLPEFCHNFSCRHQESSTVKR
jgi:hypothetical protein